MIKKDKGTVFLQVLFTLLAVGFCQMYADNKVISMSDDPVEAVSTLLTATHELGAKAEKLSKEVKRELTPVNDIFKLDQPLQDLVFQDASGKKQVLPQTLVDEYFGLQKIKTNYKTGKYPTTGDSGVVGFESTILDGLFFRVESLVKSYQAFDIYVKGCIEHLQALNKSIQEDAEGKNIADFYKQFWHLYKQFAQHVIEMRRQEIVRLEFARDNLTFPAKVKSKIWTFWGTPVKDVVIETEAVPVGQTGKPFVHGSLTTIGTKIATPNFMLTQGSESFFNRNIKAKKQEIFDSGIVVKQCEQLLGGVKAKQNKPAGAHGQGRISAELAELKSMHEGGLDDDDNVSVTSSKKSKKPSATQQAPAPQPVPQARIGAGSQAEGHIPLSAEKEIARDCWKVLATVFLLENHPQVRPVTQEWEQYAIEKTKISARLILKELKAILYGAEEQIKAGNSPTGTRFKAQVDEHVKSFHGEIWGLLAKKQFYQAKILEILQQCNGSWQLFLEEFAKNYPYPDDWINLWHDATQAQRYAIFRRTAELANAFVRWLKFVVFSKQKEVDKRLKANKSQAPAISAKPMMAKIAVKPVIHLNTKPMKINLPVPVIKAKPVNVKVSLPTTKITTQNPSMKINVPNAANVNINQQVAHKIYQGYLNKQKVGNGGSAKQQIVLVR